MRGSEIQEQLTGGDKEGVLATARQFVEAFYECDYRQFFRSLADIEVQRIKQVSGLLYARGLLYSPVDRTASWCRTRLSTRGRCA